MARAASGSPGRFTGGRSAWFRPGWSTGRGCRILAPFLERVASFDVLLIGTGAALAVLPPASAEARAKLEAAGAGAEVMATPSACRTYNVLLAEGRRVAAALMPI